MFAKLIVAAFLLFSFHSKISASDSIRQHFMPVVLEGLKASGHRLHDLAMPTDLAARDDFRLNLMDTLFENPLKTIDVISREADLLFENYLNPDRLFHHVSQMLDAEMPDKKFAQKKLEEMMNFMEAAQLRSKNPEFAYVLERFLNRSLQVQELIDVAFKNIHPDTLEMLFVELPALFKDEPEEHFQSNQIADYKKREYASIERSKRLFSHAADFNLNSMLKAGKIGYSAALELMGFLQKNEQEIPKMRFDTKAGLVNLGDAQVDEYLLWIPGKGDNLIDLRLKQNRKRFRVLINPGGNNFYRAGRAGLGGSFGGVDILIDMEGDDIYQAESYSQGSGFMGVGILIDLNGNDRYLSSYSSQGCGAFGVGFLFDRSGNDVYEGNQYVQGVGWVKGYGALVDLDGHDQYLARPAYVDALRYDDRFLTLSQGMGMGHRPHASGGIGILADYAGNDLYLSDIYGQGSAYWYALGGLVDRGGHDRYHAYQYAQGSGVHLAFAGLLDYGGKDNYIANGVSQGCGHDYAFGFLIDLGDDDDNFVCEGLSQGAGNANGYGLFIAEGGSNGYISKRTNAKGYANFRRAFGTTAIFADLGDNPFFGSLNAVKNGYWNAGKRGTGMDLTSDFLVGKEKPKSDLPAEEHSESEETPFSFSGETDLQQLFWYASAAPLKFQPKVQPARDRLLEIGTPALEFIMQQLHSESVREVHLFRTFLPDFGEDATLKLRDSLYSESDFIVSRALFLLSECSRKGYGIEVAEDVKQFLDDDNWQRRSNALMFLSRLEQLEFTPLLEAGLEDEHHHVRRSAAEGLSRFAVKEIKDAMADALMDSFEQVRYYAAIYFRQLSSDLKDFLLKEIIKKPETPKATKILALEALHGENLNRAQYRYLLSLMQADWTIRAAVTEFYASGEHPRFFERQMHRFIKEETHPYVLSKIQ